jgi:hypothetical protein
MKKIGLITSNWLAVLVFVFLLLPKVPITSENGVLIGEILLFLYVIFNLPKLMRYNAYALTRRTFFSFLTFLFVYTFFSSSIGSLSVSVFPVRGFQHFLRILLYSALTLIVTRRNHGEYDDEFYYRIFRNSLVTHMIFSGLYFAFAYTIRQPSLGDMLGSVEAGSRLLPMYGLTFVGARSLPLDAVAGGSGNLLATHGLFVLIMASRFEKSVIREVSVMLMIAFALLLAQSRGGFLTIIFWVACRLCLICFSRRTGFLAPFIISAFLGAALPGFIFLGQEFAVFDRFSALVSGELDGSSAARLENYQVLFSKWVESPVAVIFGLGFDERVLALKTGWDLVESLFLSILFCSGLLGAVTFIYFYVCVFFERRRGPWGAIIFNFIIFNSVINWSVTGGDLLGAPALFFIFIALGLQARSLRNSEQNRCSVLGLPGEPVTSRVVLRPSDLSGHDILRTGLKRFKAQG